MFVEYAKDQKRIFLIQDDLHRSQELPIRDDTFDVALANHFCCFFTSKIEAIRSGFNIVDDGSYEEPTTAFHELSPVTPATEEGVLTVICNASTT